jgi:alpha-mannosidase
MKSRVVIVPHTHWDREWYLPFQRFRLKLVHLIDELLEILNNHDYTFMLDGQTILIEDYLEIHPEKKDEFLKRIREGKIVVGPWYLLPDEWLVGGESLIRNLEYSQSLSNRMKIPLMDLAYLPDQFGHSSVIPQLLYDLTSLRTVVLWRGVPSKVTTVPFAWASHSSSNAEIRGIYLPGGYGNFAILPDDYEAFVNLINDNIAELEPFSPVPVYLLMNGSDHRYPQAYAIDYVNKMRSEGHDISIGTLREYADLLDQRMTETNHAPTQYVGEFRSPARAPLLQDTYSARMWIKIWNQRVEDALTMRAEPVSSYLWFHLRRPYPYGFMETAWKWLMKNQPHDSICGCSVDQTHNEMKSRFSWAESIGESVIDDTRGAIQKAAVPSATSSLLVFNASGSVTSPVFFEFSYPKEKNVKGIQGPDGIVYDVQPLTSRQDIFMETTVGLTMAKMGMRLIPGRKLMDFYINGVEYFDGDEPGLLELRFISDRHPVGDFDIEEFKREARSIIESKRFKKVHLVAARPTQSVYASLIPLQPWSFTQLIPVPEAPNSNEELEWTADSNNVENRFYSVSFNKDGSLNLLNKETETVYSRVHVFEDVGDRGDEYTFGRVEPEKAKAKNLKRTLITSGMVFAEIHQTMLLEVFESIDVQREKRVGSTTIPVDSTFRFYRNSPRIEITTKIVNKAKDHRLRVTFDLPFVSGETITSTHFGCILRNGSAEIVPPESELERTRSTYPEKPSGIQPQKQFIRVESDTGKDAITILNRGLPEVELVEGNRLALTLIRSIGWLSRSDNPARPIHAGPPEETPGSQEFNSEYEFKYAFLAHTKDAPMHESAEHADTFSDEPMVISFNEAEPPKALTESILRLNNPYVRISSLRVKDEALYVTLYNINNSEISALVDISERINKASEVRLDGSEKEEIQIVDHSLKLVFRPREIKMCKLETN